MAESLFHHQLKPNSTIAVQSAGVAASDGSPASIETRKILLDHGIDFSSFRSQQLTEDLLNDADYVFCLSRMHREAILSEMPECRERVLLLGEFLGAKEPQDIFDPFGLGEEAYKAVEAQILIAVENIMAFIEETSALQKDLSDES